MIVDPGRLALFLAASAALILVPGPAVLFIVARSLSQGRRAGLVSVLGIGSGNAVHAAAGVLGLAALLASSPLAFAAVRYAGAAYLVFLGVASLVRGAEKEGEGRAGEAPPEAPGSVFRQAFVVAVLNPKTALFFLAFLPQFVDPARGAAWMQMLLLGGLFLGLAVASDSAYALLAGTVGGWLRRHPAVAGRRRYLSAAVYVGLGALAALSGP
ncbi:MAG TPA: LysE family translocator [Anaeromyxobacteraceae bacterium]|nr:LysE family translocator [Anaeromyxobacteraceae bacterium]